MDTIEQFNEIINVWKTPPGKQVVVAVGDGRESIRSLSDGTGRGIAAFRAMIDYGVYWHVALIDNGRVMAIWHAQSATSAAPEAARADAPAIPLAGSDGWELMEVSEVEALREENAKLLKSEQAYYERNEALEKELETRERDNGKLISSLRPFYKAYAADSEDAKRIMDEMPLTFDEWAISYIAQHEAMRKELESAEDTIRVLKKRAADALSEGE